MLIKSPIFLQRQINSWEVKLFSGCLSNKANISSRAANLHYVSDAQKYFTLKHQPGLITEGLFACRRNTNYLGEILIYVSFALLAQHWLPFLILAGVVSGIFIPNMLRKDQSLSRYPEFAAYKAQSGLLLPKLWVGSSFENPTLAQKPE